MSIENDSTQPENEEKITYPEKIARELFATMELVGCNPKNHSMIQNILWTFHCSCQVVWVLAVFTYNFCCYKSMSDFIEHIMFTAISAQVLLKFLICRVYSAHFSVNLDTLFKVFWTEEDIVEQGRESYLKLYKSLHGIVIFYKRLFLYSALTIILETQITTPGKPFFAIWTPKSVDINNEQPYAIILYFLEVFSIAGCVMLAIVPLDSIYILLVGSAYIQFDCLISTMKNLDYDNRDNAFKTIMRCVSHHNLILVYLKKVEQVYNISMLSLLCAILLTICIAIYISSLDIYLGIRPFLYAMLSSSQLFIYCLGGQMLTEQGISLSDAVYESKWWSLPDKSIRSALIMMIQRAQRPIFITAGNVFVLSLELFGKVLKAAVSFMTMLRTTTSK